MKPDYKKYNFCIVCKLLYLKSELRCINGCNHKLRTKPKKTMYKNIPKNAYIDNSVLNCID